MPLSIQITDQEIEWATRILLPADATFNKERQAFIRCLESRDVIACPGSGKTTALLAKLLILASKMPFSDGKGICVLTHTNVAIDEIRERAGAEANILFQHPNFFGTIQGFVNKYLALPFYRQKFNKPVQAVDGEMFVTSVRAKLKMWKYIGLKKFLEHRRDSDAVLINSWLKAADLSVGKDLDKDIANPGRHTPSFSQIAQIRQLTLEEGILNYNDAYSLALHYIQHTPKVAETLRHRFKFVFIDEMQDTASHQGRLLGTVFPPNTNSVVQRIGDPNQAIYSGTQEAAYQWQPNQPFHFSDSHRYGKCIADLLSTVRVDCSLSLKPNVTRQSLSPHLLVYNQSEERLVLPCFAKLIAQNKLHKEENSVFKAVGHVGKEKEAGKSCIPSYFPEFENLSKKNTIWRHLFYDFIEDAQKLVCSTSPDIPKAYSLLKDALTLAVKKADYINSETDRAYTKTELFSHLKEKHDSIYNGIKKLCAEQIFALRNGQADATLVHNQFVCLIKKVLLGKALPPALSEFLIAAGASECKNSTLSDEASSQANIYVDSNGICIEIGTVHSVKGETHTATLFLETFFKKVDMQRLRTFCCHDHNEKLANMADTRANLKIAHVAFSRPTHLLGFACVSDNVQDKKELKTAGWKIVNVKEYLGES